MQYAATIMQTNARSRVAQSQYISMKRAMICIQAWIRGHTMYRNIVCCSIIQLSLKLEEVARSAAHDIVRYNMKQQFYRQIPGQEQLNADIS